ncbi:MAG: ferrous iron transporter B [Vicinamibacteria bacterium]|nr:ferrous iron transporter B [Vicinamibacteria bacterium]
MEPKERIDILLVGHPNVGKSVLFTRLTGVKTIVSNYAGTTVTYTRGRLRFEGKDLDVVDAPGVYSLAPLDDAARVTIDLVDRAERVINIVDATHIERHLPLTLELLARNRPVFVALNMSDEARHLGIEIDVEKLSKCLGVPVVATVGRSGEGVRALMESVMGLPRHDTVAVGESGPAGRRQPRPRRRPSQQTPGHGRFSEEEVWQRIGRIVNEVQSLHHHHHTLGERLAEISVHPIWGALFAFAVLVSSLFIISALGGMLVSGELGPKDSPWISLPFGTERLFDAFWRPALETLAVSLGEESVLTRLLVGHAVGGHIDFETSFGLLSTGLFVPFGLVLPFIFSFYFVLSVLEDTGYLPRLAIFLDTIMHRVGLHGYAIIPTLLGLGCNVPGILATRILETRQQRFITATLISIAVPCASLQAVIIGLVGARGWWAVGLVYGILLITWFTVGFALRFVSREFRPELLVEIPPYRVPVWRVLFSKIGFRLRSFLIEAVPLVLVSVLAANVFEQLGVFRLAARATAPVVVGLWGLPEQAILPLMLGFVRKDVALGLLAPLALTTRQLVTGTVVLAAFFPCLASFVVLFRELGARDGLKSTAIMLAVVTLLGATVNFGWIAVSAVTRMWVSP